MKTIATLALLALSSPLMAHDAQNQPAQNQVAQTQPAQSPASPDQLVPAPPTQKQTSPEQGAQVPPVPTLLQDPSVSLPKIAIHGYLTQAFAKTDGEQILGIDRSGTADYRRAALLGRFTPTRKDALVLQVAHRRLGRSPSLKFEHEVKIDWAFYERRLADNTSVRVGRLPQPMGLQNETRYVGTLLPFYRTPYNFYQEGSFTSETIDGLAVRQSIAPASSWNAELAVYGGQFSMIEQSDAGLVQPRAKKAIGGQLWVNTPVSGLRLGLGGQALDLTGTALVRDGQDNWKSYYASAEYAGSRLKLRSEYRNTEIHDADVNFSSYYVYVGFSLTSRLAVHGQFDTSKLDLGVRAGSLTTIPTYYRDWTAGTTFAVRPDVVLKGEYHWTESQLLETSILPLGAPSRPVNYGIVSMSVSF